ncbi:MAG: phosphoribosylformylglycinamidine synthase subunit PurQ [SAR324 cluster bacterium]|nr:phosphoribosylformylglycinamidine synthase subunit PurQ [SAR324 cluster bacterium]
MKTPRTLILSGYGLNCDKETAYCCRLAGGNTVDVVHTSKIIRGEIQLKDYQFLIFIGGFLDGDDLGAGRVGANRFKYGILQRTDLKLHDQLIEFVEADKLILGICNGFQVLVKLGLLPATGNRHNIQEVSITSNANNQFENRWVHLKVNPNSHCIFTRGIPHLYLPVRHGEGRIEGDREEVLKNLLVRNQVPLQYASPENEVTERYPDNPNGSPWGIASMSNQKGNVMGLMPHPEAFHHFTNHPHWTRLTFQGENSEEGEGLSLFKNAYRYLND